MNGVKMNEIVTTTDAPLAFGSRGEIEAIANRIKVMLPSACLADWQLGDKYREEAEKNLREALYRAAQLCVFYRLVPGEDVHIIPFGNSFSVDLGIESWKKAADRYCAQHGITYHLHCIDMPTENVKERRGDLYDANDVGAIAYLWRSDKEGVYRIFGAEEAMTKGYGLWCVKARWNKNKKEWQADTIPVQRSKQDVATRRAMKMALKKEFSLDSLLAKTPADLASNVRQLESDIRYEEIQQTPIARPQQFEIEEDGDILWARSEQDMAQSAQQNGTYVVVEEENDEPFEEDAAATDDGIDYAGLIDRLQDKALQLANWTRQKHAQSNGPATDDQYRYLVGVIDALTQKGAHRPVLAVLVGRTVDGANPPGYDMVHKLLDLLAAEKTEEVDGKKVKVANPHYREDVAGTVVTIWNVVQEAQGQLALVTDEELESADEIPW